MIDSSRHFETLSSIRAIIRSLPFAKINVLHWHMSDTQSFPMQSMSSPKLWEASSIVIITIYGRITLDSTPSMRMGGKLYSHYYHIWTYNPRFYSLYGRQATPPRRDTPNSTLQPSLSLRGSTGLGSWLNSICRATQAPGAPATPRSALPRPAPRWSNYSTYVHIW
jgi:hypothetical protein